MKIDWNGIYPAATTQFRDDETLNLPATAKHLDRMIRAGVDGLIMLGTVGENTSLDPDEKIDVLKMAIETSAGRVPVLTGVAEYTTPQACRYAAAAAEAGVDGLMVLPAMVYKTCPRETLAHFRAVAEATPLPIMVYNNPVAYGTDITPEMFVELMDTETIVAIKESSEDLRRITDLRNLTGDHYVLFGGVDDLALECLLLGADGWVSGLVNAFPEESRRLWDLALAGQWAEAREIYRWYTPLLHLDTMPKLVQYIKLAVAECGLGSEMVRAPRLILEGGEREKILAIIRTGIAARPVGKQVG
jgi:4-hydroxy-tetrahydrodipicolinate synthase